jgi:hypothetical protein
VETTHLTSRKGGVAMLRIFVFCSLGCCIPGILIGHTWTDCTGLEKFDAEIASVANGVVTFTKDDGTSFKMPIDKLSNSDVTFVRQYIKKSQYEHRTPPDPALSETGRQAATINDFVEKLREQIGAAAATDTSVRMTAAHDAVVQSLDAELKRTNLVFRFPIKNVAGNRSYTLTLAAPEGIGGITGYPETFSTTLAPADAVRITTNHVLVVHGRGRLIYGSSPAQVYSTAACLADIYIASTKQYYGIYLENYAWKTEREIRVKPDPLPNGVAPVARAAAWPKIQPQAPPAAVTEPVAPATPIEPPSGPEPPAQSSTKPPPSLDDLIPRLMPPKQSAPAVQPVPTEVPTAKPEVARHREPPTSHRMDLRLASAKYLHSKLTPEMLDQRKARMKRMFGDSYDGWAKQPNIWVGGFISSVFWYSTAQWPSDRQAVWLYNYHDVIEPDLLAERLQDGAVSNAYWEIKRTSRAADPYFVDPAFKDDPDLMYRDEFVDAVYRDVSFEDEWSMPYSWLIAGVVAGIICIIAWSKHEGYF